MNEHNPSRTTAPRILLVDDDTEVLKALKRVLEKEGYTIVAQPNGNAALAYLESAQEKFDLVITDVSMPGMRGTTLLAALKAEYPHMPVILITAFGDWGQYMDALRNCAFEYLSKPIDKTELQAVVKRALHSVVSHTNGTVKEEKAKQQTTKGE